MSHAPMQVKEHITLKEHLVEQLKQYNNTAATAPAEAQSEAFKEQYAEVRQLFCVGNEKHLALM